ncbi:MAG: hypothetical protein Q8P06_01790 [Candidatus Azambacteria bacterium]|nr:hypothetical protein [Candidatus Azambacteria bacterium]
MTIIPDSSAAVRFFSRRQKRTLIIFSVIFFIALVASGTVFYFWLTSFKESLIDFSISGPDQISSGENSDFIVSYWNNTNQVLQNANLIIRYPQGAIVDGGKNIQNIDLGDIGIGGGGKREINATLVGADKSIQKIEAILSYRPQNNSSTFENKISKEVIITDSALSIEFKIPEIVMANVKNIYVVHYKNNTEKVFQNVSIEAVYPSGFSFISADRMPAKNNNTWNLGDLNPNEEGDITITGVLKDDQNVNFELAIGIIEGGKFHQFNQISSEINLVVLPLKIDISVNNQSNMAVNPGDNLRFKIHYENNSDIALLDVIIKAKLEGLMYDFSSLKTVGYFNGLDGTITWNGGNWLDFKSLPAGASGDVEFDLNVKPKHIVRTFRDKNFLLNVSATIETATAPQSLKIKKLSVTDDLTIQLNTKTELKTAGYYYDQTIKNSGPLPPKVGQTTTYTVHWQVTNYSNDVESAKVKTILPEGISWLDKKSGAGAATLEYNDRTGELVWDIGKVTAGTGVLLSPYEVIFQVGLTPSINKVNMIVPILSASALTGKDAFTGVDILTTAPVLNSDLPDDPGVDYPKSRVQP